jgi:hypothetical protein
MDSNSIPFHQVISFNDRTVLSHPDITVSSTDHPEHRERSIRGLFPRQARRGNLHLHSFLNCDIPGTDIATAASP